jgi:hypothetical protein
MHPFAQKTGTYASREIEIHRDLTKAVAARDGLRLDHPRSKSEAESIAYDLLQLWPCRRRDPQDELERLCEANYQNNQEWQEHRLAMKAIRDEMAAAKAPPPPDPDFVTLYMRDDLSRKLYKVRLPASSVEVL